MGEAGAPGSVARGPARRQVVRKRGTSVSSRYTRLDSIDALPAFTASAEISSDGIPIGSARGSLASVSWLCSCRFKATSHPQQSLHREHFSHRSLSQLSFGHATQIRVDSSSQMLQVKPMV